VLSGFFFYTMEKRSRECNVFRANWINLSGRNLFLLGGKDLVGSAFLAVGSGFVAQFQT
jgi:hypothetical protein